MGFLTGYCCERWSAVTHCSVGGRGARILDITVLGPMLTLIGSHPKVPKFIGLGLISVGVGISAYNTARLVVGDVREVEVSHIDLDALREAGL